MEKAIGKWAFVLGVVVAIIAALVPIPASFWILVILGLIVGFLNVTARETTEFLVATIALMAMSGTDLLKATIATGILAGIFGNIITFIAPAALVVALKAIYSLGED